MSPSKHAKTRAASLGLAGCLITGLAGAAEPPAGGTTIVEDPRGYQLFRDGEPYYIRGAGAVDRLDALAAAGGNSVRTWGSEQTAAVIDAAGALGLTVTAGLWIEHERHGFDYADDAAVAAQIRDHCAAVDRFKDHPALLMWAVGNEVSIEASQDRVWEVIEAVARYIKEVDPRHPVLTVLPHVSAAEVAAIRSHCPSIDLLGFNCYKGIDVIGADARRFGWDGPFIISEWGPDGNWEVAKTEWGAEIEPTSTDKATLRRQRYARILEDPHCLGSYAFYWGQKQETTPTWFNLFLESGSPVEGVEAMEYLWTGRSVEPPAPRITPLKLNGVVAEASLVVPPQGSVEAEFTLWHAAADAVSVRWELLPESADKRVGGDREARPDTSELKVDREHPDRIVFAAPSTPGAYRLFVYVENAAGRAATANFPFLVAASQ